MGGITICHSHQQKKTPQQNSEVGNLSKLYLLFGYVVTCCGEVDVQTWSSFCFKSIYVVLQLLIKDTQKLHFRH